MKWALEILKPLTKRIAVGTSIKIIGTVAELMIPFLLSHILENVIVNNNVSEIVLFGILMAVCAVIAGAGNVIANRMAAKTTMLFSRKMRHDLFSKTLDLSARRTDHFTIPSLEARITSDTYNVQNFIGMMQRMGIRAPILLLGGTAITMIMDRRLALVMLATAPLIFIVVYLAIGYFYQKNRTKNLSIDDYEIKNVVISHIKEETYTIRKRNAIDKTMCVYIMYFENGKSWNIPKDNYLWSGECPMSDRTLYQTTHRGDVFWVVTKKDTCEIVVAYPTEYFEYKN